MCKKYFSDVINNDWVCRAVEIAADLGFVSRSNSTYRPQANITRAESLALVYQASNLDTKLPTDWEAKLMTKLLQDSVNLFVPQGWQSTLIRKAYFLNILDTSSLFLKNGTYSFRENDHATRAEVFRFTRNTYKIRSLMSGEVTL